MGLVELFKNVNFWKQNLIEFLSSEKLKKKTLFLNLEATNSFVKRKHN